METNRIFINQHFLSAIFNDDYSGIENSDERNIVIDFVVNEIENQTVNVESESTSFCRCCVTGLYSDCVEISLHSFEDKKAV